ncbi:MAG: agmatine deiminase family protein [Deferribacterales bacterium]
MNSKRIFPAEWFEQACVQLTWPHKDTDWSNYLSEADECFYNIAKAISEREKLIIVSRDIDRVKQLTIDLNLNNIIYLEIPNNDTWARDHGGITVFQEDRPIILNFQFNGWGLKFPANLDNQITREMFNKAVFSKNVILENHLRFVLEGGSIESDGNGSLMVTSYCLMSKNRNEGLSRVDVENYLKETLGIENILWLEHGFLIGDDTDSHIDTLARFCDEGTICYIKCYDADDPHHEELAIMEDELKSFKNLNGENYNLVPLPLPEPIYYNGERLPATYANFLIINGAVLVPTYNSNKDGEAIEIFKSIFSSREIIPIDCSVLIRQHGSLHCVTMQYPKGVL